MGAMDKVLNMMMPDLQDNKMANLLGIDNVKKARGRGLLDAGLTMMAMSGPRPQSENINPAMIMKMGLDAGTKTYDSAMDKQLNNYKTNLALQTQTDKKESFANLMDSDLFTTDEKEYAKMLGAVDGGDFLSKVYMQKLKKVDTKPSVKEMVIIDENTGFPKLRDDGKILKQYVDIKDIMEAPNKYQIPDSEGTFAKNISDFETILGRKLTLEEKTNYIEGKMNGQNISFTTGADGSTTLQIGGSSSGSGDMEKKSKGTIEQNILNASYNFETFKEIKKLYKPEFSTIDTKLAIKWAKFKEAGGEWSKALGLNVSDEEKELIEAYSQWEQKSWEATNQYIKSITGAQMSEAEAERILKGFADPRKFSPTEYQAKLNGILDSAKKSTIRYNLILRSGIEVPLDSKGNPAPERILSLGSVDKYVNDIGKELKKELLNTEAYNGFTDKEINDEVRKQLKILMFGDTTQNAFTLKDLQ
tara:strand:- start:89 stop:1510 length:1422 start_codon:yes stop_codon:yes gene_type:complete